MSKLKCYEVGGRFVKENSENNRSGWRCDWRIFEERVMKHGCLVLSDVMCANLFVLILWQNFIKTNGPLVL